MIASTPRLLVVAHGTAAPAGRHTTERLVAAIAADRDVPVDLCFLDVVAPRLPEVLDDSPTVLLPLLLSTGYHVRSDIPAAVVDYPRTTVARHLGPDEDMTDVLVDRLGAVGAAVVLAGAGSSRSEARAELDAAAVSLGRRIDRDVVVATMADDLPAMFARLPRPLSVATYLLAEGQFVSSLHAAADSDTTVAAPLGVHPALVRLAWRRYDDALAAG